MVVRDVAELTTHGGRISSGRLDDETERALQTLESSGLTRSEAIRSSLLSSAARLRRGRELADEAAALEADDEGPSCAPTLRSS